MFQTRMTVVDTAKHLTRGLLPVIKAKKAEVVAVVAVVMVPRVVIMTIAVAEGVVEDAVVTACLTVSTLRTTIEEVVNHVANSAVEEAAVGALPITTTNSVTVNEVVAVAMAATVVVMAREEEVTSNASISTRRGKTETRTTPKLAICSRTRNIRKSLRLKVWRMTVLITWAAARTTRDRVRGLTRTWELPESTWMVMITARS